MGAFGAKSLKPTWLYSSSFASLFGPFSFPLGELLFPIGDPKAKKDIQGLP
jgi:hypothetical protein